MTQDPEEKVFIPPKDYSSITEDPSVGAVLCGFDANISQSDVYHFFER